jgi:hypothetical protein
MPPSNDGVMATEALAASNHLGFHLSFSTGRGCNLPTTYAICAVDFDHWHPRFTRSTRKNAGIGEGLAMARLTLKGAGRMNTLIKLNPEYGGTATVKLFVCCLVDSEWQAVNIVDHFHVGGFARDEISMLFSSRFRSASMESEGGFAIQVLDHALGGFNVLLLPALGSFLGAGPIMDAFASPEPDFREDLSMPLRTFGISQNRAQYYTERLSGGEILIAVHSAELDRAKHAEQIFYRSGAKDIGYSGSLILLSPPEEEAESMVLSGR